MMDREILIYVDIENTPALVGRLSQGFEPTQKGAVVGPLAHCQHVA
jgi:hypothetical protein